MGFTFYKGKACIASTKIGLRYKLVISYGYGLFVLKLATLVALKISDICFIKMLIGKLALADFLRKL